MLYATRLLGVLGLLLVPTAVGCSTGNNTGPGSDDHADIANRPADGSRNDASQSDVDNTPYDGPHSPRPDVAPFDAATDVTPPDAFSTLPPLEHVVVTLNDDSADIRFDPVDGALDYRVYVMPASSDISAGPGPAGDLVVHNALYRCAGSHEARTVPFDADRTGTDQVAVSLTTYHDFMRTTDEATLGYVFTDPGPGRVPVYALGDPRSDHSAQERFDATRAKLYTTSDSDRTTKLAQRWRDFGIVFYVPSTADSSTRPFYFIHDTSYPGNNYRYLTDGREYDALSSGDRSAATMQFNILRATQAGAQPLMRVLYLADGLHDELAVGNARFQQVLHQGAYVLNRLTWSGITGPTTLVVEALDSGCPYQGYFSSDSAAGFDTYPQRMTIADLRAASPTTEVFMNGQFDAGNRPRAIRRTFIQVQRDPREQMDWFDGFHVDAPFAPLSDDSNVSATVRHDVYLGQWFASTDYQVEAERGENRFFSIGPSQGELWVNYADAAADLEGKYRFGPKRQAQMASDSFLHVTMEVDGFSTGRRYPQMWISDQPWPLQENLSHGHAILLQTFEFFPAFLQLEVCNRQGWGVTMQCPTANMAQPTGADGTQYSAPVPIVGERWAPDHRMRFDLYTSTSRAYVFLDNEPYGCVNLPPSQMVAGPVTIAFGSVLYHSGVDLTYDPSPRDYPYHAIRETEQDRRHFDNLGFSSHVLPPEWDENVMPCQAPPQ